MMLIILIVMIIIVVTISNQRKKASLTKSIKAAQQRWKQLKKEKNLD